MYQDEKKKESSGSRRCHTDEYNKKLGLSKPQATAMYWGSVYGFDTPGADPKQYDADGIMIKPVRKDRDAR